MYKHSPEAQEATSPADAKRLLEEGNRRFLQRQPFERDLLHEVEETRGGQWPFAVVLSCIDSRVPPELVFDCGIGDVFSVRVAGNFVNTDNLGSIEYGCKVAHAKLIVVLGHRGCGAVKGACDGVELGNLTAMLTNLKPAVDAVAEPADPAQRSSKNPEFVDHVAEANVRLNLERLLAESDVLREQVEAGEIQVVGAMYDITSGKVDFLD